MTMQELVAAAGGGQVTARFVRFLIAEGVIPPPSGGRAHAVYGAEHLQGVVGYIRLRALGLSTKQVRSVLRAAQAQTVPLQLAPGLALHIDLAAFDRRSDPGAIARLAEAALTDLLASRNSKGTIDVDAA
jgi:DNA-binding transcriptional MerR regulator